MRYESFYPFARNQPQPPRQQAAGFNPYARPPQGQQPFFGMPNNQFAGPRQGQAIPNQQQGAPAGLSKMEGYMETANRFLNTAQQYAPVVQQFAPMMRNLPAMWKLYKGFQSMPPASGASAGPPAANPNPAGGIRTASVPRTSAQPTNLPSNPRPSLPRIFQPTDL